MAFIDTQARPAGEVQQKVGRIKLSEAIRIGARIRPQCSARWFDDDGNSCAAGAAAEGAGWKEEAEEYERENHAQPWHLLREKFGISEDMMEQMWRKNDSGESRESIADWLAAQGL